jgi:Fe-S cluster biogenesis protein NfuA
MNRPLNIYAELTPNPNSLKFVADVMLLEGGTVEYNSKEEAINCPLASQLFDFSGVTKVFITTNFVTINKVTELEWYDVTNIIREFIRGFLMSGEPLFIGSPFDENHIPASAKKVVVQSKPVIEKKQEMVEEAHVDFTPDPEADKKIIELLDEYVRPAVEGDGGAIHFQSFTNGVVNVVLKGACSGCPSSTITLKSGIENLLKRMVPGVREVVAVGE